MICACTSVTYTRQRAPSCNHGDCVSVIGVLVSQATLKEFVVTELPECNSLLTKCYLLDDGGFIIMSTEEEEDSYKVFHILTTPVTHTLVTHPSLSHLSLTHYLSI